MTFDDMADMTDVGRKPLYSVPDAARVLGYSPSLLYGEIERGRLGAMKPQGARRGIKMRAEWLDAWMDGNTAFAVERKEGTE